MQHPDVAEMLRPLLSIYLDNDAMSLVLAYHPLICLENLIVKKVLEPIYKEHPINRTWFQSILDQDWYAWMHTFTQRMLPKRF